MLSIERFEDSLVLCEDENEETVTLSRDDVPFEAKEGDMLVLNAEGLWEIDCTTTKELRRSLFSRHRQLSEK